MLIELLMSHLAWRKMNNLGSNNAHHIIQNS